MFHTIIRIPNKRSTSQIQKLISNGAQKDELLLVHNEAEFIGLYQENFRTPPKYNLVPYDINFRRKVKSNRILFADRFPKQPRNVDYLQEDDRFFSEDHLYYLEERFKGFSDYSIVGSEFSESGFAPMAVAIHIVYFDADETLKVRHFVSDSNEDITDPAGKFYEALTKLISWSKTQSLNTDAIKEFQKHYDNETYPGLGYVKKLCLKHHIELMNQYLSSRGTNQ